MNTHNCNAFHPSSESNFGSGLALETRARRDTEARMVSVMFNPKSISLLPVQRRAKARGQRKHEAASNVEVSGKAWGNVSNVPLADFLQVQVHGHMTTFSFSTYSSSQGFALAGSFYFSIIWILDALINRKPRRLTTFTHDSKT